VNFLSNNYLLFYLKYYNTYTSYDIAQLDYYNDRHEFINDDHHHDVRICACELYNMSIVLSADLAARKYVCAEKLF